MAKKLMMSPLPKITIQQAKKLSPKEKRILIIALKSIRASIEKIKASLPPEKK
jgi:hypothetical protein